MNIYIIVEDIGATETKLQLLQPGVAFFSRPKKLNADNHL